MYCAEHDSVGCHVCFTINHKSCQDIHYIPEYVETTKQTENVRNINDKVEKAISKMNNLIKKKQKYFEDSRTTKVTCMKEIQAFRKDINEALDRLEQASIAKLNTTFGNLEEIQEELKKIQNTLDKLAKCKAEMESSQRNPSQTFVNMKISEKIISEMKKVESKLTDELKGRISFERNSEILHFLQNLESFANKVYEVKSKKSCIVSLNDENMISDNLSSCILDSGDILVEDNNNKKIKLFDCDTYKVKSSKKMSDGPESICRVSSVEAAVSLYNKTVQFVSTKNSLMPTRSLLFDHNCRGIAAVDDQLVMCSSNKVYVYTMNGERLKTIEKDSAGSTIFNQIREICLSENGKAIHMTDEIAGLITIYKDGNVMWKYAGQILKDPWGVCTDENGNMFVSGARSSNVIQLKSDGTFVAEVVSKAHGLNCPTVVSFDRKRYKLIVAKLVGNELDTFHVQ